MSIVVDAHVHVHALNDARYPYAPVSGHLPRYFPQRTMTFAQLETALPTGGVDKAVLVQFAGMHGVVDNSYVMDSAAQRPGQLVAVCSLDPHAPDVVAQTEDWVARGAAGLRVISHAGDAPPEHVRQPAIWEAAQRLGSPLKAHLLRGMNSAVGMPWVVDMVKRFPGVRVVLDNVGNVAWTATPPFGIEPVLPLVDSNAVMLITGVCFDRWAEAGTDPAAALRRLVDTFGADRIMWGSDAPNSPGAYADLVRRQRRAIAGFSTAEQEWILGRTAQHVYPGLA